MKILEPIEINGLEIKNRIAMAPCCTKFANFCGSVSERLINFYRERAKGEVGLIFTGFAYVDNEASRVSVGQLSIADDKFLPGLNWLVESIKEYGSKVFIQLCHGGRQSRSRVTGCRQY